MDRKTRPGTWSTMRQTSSPSCAPRRNARSSPDRRNLHLRVFYQRYFDSHFMPQRPGESRKTAHRNAETQFAI